MLNKLLLFRPNAAPLVLPQSSPHHPQLSQVPDQYSLCLWTKQISGSESGSRPGSAMSSAPSEGGGARSKEVRANTLIFLRFFSVSPTPSLTIPQTPAKPKGKPETGTLRKETKREPKREEPKKRDASPEENIVSRRKRHDSDEGEASKGHFFVYSFPIWILMCSYLHPLWALLNHFYSAAYSHPFYNKYIRLLQYCTPHIFHMQTQQVRNYIYPVLAVLYFASIVGFAFSSQFKLSHFSRC